MHVYKYKYIHIYMYIMVLLSLTEYAFPDNTWSRHSNYLFLDTKSDPPLILTYLMKF